MVTMIEQTTEVSPDARSYDSPMVLRPVSYLKKAMDDEHRWQAAAFVFCFLFGLAMIANTFGTADGMWFWYADLLRNGELLYSHPHLALQPLFVLATALFM